MLYNYNEKPKKKNTRVYYLPVNYNNLIFVFNLFIFVKGQR